MGATLFGNAASHIKTATVLHEESVLCIICTQAFSNLMKWYRASSAYNDAQIGANLRWLAIIPGGIVNFGVGADLRSSNWLAVVPPLPACSPLLGSCIPRVHTDVPYVPPCAHSPGLYREFIAEDLTHYLNFVN